MRRTAAHEDGDTPRAWPGPGRPIAEWDPHALEVHPAGPVSGPRMLPGYVRRAHDQVLAQAVEEARQGQSRMVVLIGSSSTGKTRSCWESVQPLAEAGWRLWHPFDPTRASAALDDLHRVGPRTVVWLNEAQHYLGDNQLGEQIAAAVHTLLTQSERGPVLVLGTLWPEYERQYQSVPAPGSPDPHSRVRELLAASRTVTVPAGFDAEALRAAAALARRGDRLLADALTRASAHGQVTQDLAGAPQLLYSYEHGSPAARAMLEAAMDARRLGIGLHLPQTFLTDAALDYLTEAEYDHLADDWAEAAYAELARPVHGRQAPLRRASPRPIRRPPGTLPPASPGPAAGPVFRLADYLEQHGRVTRMKLCPPLSFWAAAHAHLTDPDSLATLAEAATRRSRLQWAHHLWHRACEAGSVNALTYLVEFQETAGNHHGAEDLAHQAAASANTRALSRLAELRRAAGDNEGADLLDRKAADAGDGYALARLAGVLELAGERQAAEAAAYRAATAGNPDGLMKMADLRRAEGKSEDAERLYQQTADAGVVEALFSLAELRERTGDYTGANAFVLQAAKLGDSAAVAHLVAKREHLGRHTHAEALAKQALHSHTSDGLLELARIRELGSYHKSAERLYRQAASAGDANALAHWAWLRERRSRHGEEAEDLVQQAAAAGNPHVLYHLAELRQHRDNDHTGAEDLYRQALTTGDTRALRPLANILEHDGDHANAEALAERAAGYEYFFALIYLASVREKAGHADLAEKLYLRMADSGVVAASFDERWPYGLDPDGSPTSPWH
ncbi:sel1 repeat family protein [Streptomyces sp. A1547]|nr:sel1 repeat family protein [Streptomyces sp. A1547]